MDTTESLCDQTTFEQFAFPESIDRALFKMDFKTPTPIQLKAIPLVLSGQDVTARAPTGTGKTAAFCIPLLCHLLKNPQSMGLIMAPTRELACQIEEFWRKLTRYNPLIRTSLLIGGVSIDTQLRGLKRHPSVIIATPGRLNDHLRRKTAKISKVSYVVLDEADRMLDMGFEPQINEIFQYIPQKRQGLMFSATFSKEVQHLIQKYLTTPEYVEVENKAENRPQIKESYTETTRIKKNETLFNELATRKEGTAIIFARTRDRTERVASFLFAKGLKVECIHGGRTQRQRQIALRDFKSGKCPVLVATDVAARGIDVSNVAYVINYDLPETAHDYIHRIGRTARAGLTGEALTILLPEDRGHWKRIMKYVRNLHKQEESSR